VTGLDEAALAALQPLRSLLQADGYDLELAGVRHDRVEITIAASVDACAECLVPASIMELYVREGLKSVPGLQDAAIALAYPDKAT
jgi:hypothetical protein